jgi:hypothetical protein
MSIDGRHELHRFAQSILGAYLVAVADKVRPQAEMLAEAARDFLASERADALTDQFMKTLVQALATELNQERRGDPFRRLVCHPLTDLLDRGALSRTLLNNYFSFLHLVLGDEQEQLSGHCQVLLQELKEDPHFSWDMFYDDPRTKSLLWGVLTRVLDTFKRFEPRRDWFIGLMQNRPHAVSLGAHSFMALPRTEEEDLAPFGATEFNLMFNALYRPLLSMPAEDDGAFTRQFGAPPAVLVAPLVEKLV